MKYFYSLLLVGLIVSCGGEEATEHDNSNETVDDSLTSSIVEFDLSEERLSAVDYNNKLTLIQQNVFDQINVLFLSESSMVAQNHDNVLFEIELKSTDLENTTVPEGGASLKQALDDLLSFYKTELKNGFINMIALLEKEPEDRTHIEGLHIADYDEQFAIQEEVFFAAIEVEQDKFALANNIQMTNL